MLKAEVLAKKYPELTEGQIQELVEVFGKAEKALEDIALISEEKLNRVIQRTTWSVANKKTFRQLVDYGIEETGLGDSVTRMGKTTKMRGALRDALRAKTTGCVEEIPEKGIKKFAKPVGIISSLIPTTNPDLTPVVTATYAIKSRNVVIFSPHPRSKKTTLKTVELMREALAAEGLNPDILQCLQNNPNKPMSMAVMGESNLVLATGGQNMVRRAYTAGTPAYGVGAGNSTMVIAEDANIQEAAYNTMLSKTSDFGSGCSADGNLVIHESIYEEMRRALEEEGAYLANEEERAKLEKVMWDEDGNRKANTVAIAPQALARAAGFEIPTDRKFIAVEGTGIGPKYRFSDEKLTTLLATYKYKTFDDAMKMVKGIYEVHGKGHSCGIFSYNQDYIDTLAETAPVSRIMVRQPQSKANAGAFNNGMPMTSSLGCGTWGGNITNENVNIKHYMNYTWVSVPIPEDRPSDEELFGEFYDPSMEQLD